jgi:hypothetical protein
MASKEIHKLKPLGGWLASCDALLRIALEHGVPQGVTDERMLQPTVTTFQNLLCSGRTVDSSWRPRIGIPYDRL